MHDPFPLPRPQILDPLVERISGYLSLKTLPLHYHELALAFAFYHTTYKIISPAVSRYIFPRIYPSFNPRTKLNWDVHVVSFVQATLICTLALWVMWTDNERAGMDTTERTHGYTGASGLIQAFAGGYFLWDLVVTAQHVDIFGIGMLFHAICALCVFAFGFRPFVNYYASSFILYELSSPFLNIHWFCDKLNMTGSTLQFANGIVLLFAFFSCRLVWGTYQSVLVFGDVYRALKAGPVVLTNPAFSKLSNSTVVGNAGFKHDILQYAEGQTIPLWLAATYLASNIILNGLNWFWFGKMIETLRKRFDPPLGTRQPDAKESKPVPDNEKVLVEGTHVATPGAEEVEEFLRAETSNLPVKLEKNKTGTHLEASASEVRSRTSTRRKG